MCRRIEPLITEAQIKERVKELGKQISEDYRGKDLLLIGILKGSIPFLCSLMWEIDNEKLSMDFMDVSSYGSETVSSGNVKILKDIDSSIKGKNVMIVEDIVDTGRTMNKLLEMLKTREPASLKVCTLLDKPSRRLCDVKVDYVGFEIENKFVAGFGLDDDQYMRQLKYVGEVIFEN
ncbi:MAG: hypoxanthine phosphoribosyltransferase [Lachnospiraceae bacterium]|nr:hypoxanthine phosphoribosyltransferase [Lachnospiraceae bacterium]